MENDAFSKDVLSKILVQLGCGLGIIIELFTFTRRGRIDDQLDRIKKGLRAFRIRKSRSGSLPLHCQWATEKQSGDRNRTDQMEGLVHGKRGLRTAKPA